MKKRKFQLTLFGGLVLLGLIGICLNLWPNGSPLFDNNTKTTLYARTAVGVNPKLQAQDFFTDEDYDYTLFTFDMEGCDLLTPGTYQIPVYYDGKKTNCVVDLKVTGETPAPTVNTNEDTEFKEAK